MSATTLLGIGVTLLAVSALAWVGSEHIIGWVFVLASIPFGVLALISAHGLRGANFNLLGQGTELFVRPLLGLCLIALPLWLVEDWRNVEYALLGQLIVAILTAVIAFSLLRHKVPPQGAPPYPKLPWHPNLTAFTTSTGAMLLISQADLLLLGLWSTPEELGVYRIAMQVAVLLAFALHVANTAFSPRFAALAAQQDNHQLRSLVRAVNLSIAAITIPLTIALVWFGEYLIETIFGPAYTDAYLPMCVLVVGQAINNLTGPTGVLLNMTGHEIINRNILLGCAALVVALAVALIPSFGMLGAAYAAAISLGVRAGLQYIAVYRRVLS